MSEQLAESEAATRDFSSALDYITNWKVDTQAWTHAVITAQAAALQTFSETMQVPDPPKIAKEVALALLGGAFGVLQGWDVIERGLLRGLFAADMSRLHMGLGKRLNWQQMLLIGLAPDKGPEFNKMLAGMLARAAEEGVGAGKSIYEEAEKGGAGSETAETARISAKFREEAIKSYGDALGAARREADVARDDLKLKVRLPMYRGKLEAEMKAALGPVSQAPSGERVWDAAKKFELHLYQERFKGKCRLQVIQGSMGVYSRTIHGSGWTREVERRIKYLTGKDSIIEIAALFGFPTQVSKVVESGRMS